MSKILKGLNESRNYGRDSWDSNMPGYQGDYGGAENFGRKKRDWDENDAIDAQLRQKDLQRREYEKSGKFWLKFKDSQRHLPAGPFIGKQAANVAAIDLLKKQPELKGNLLITAYGPDEKLNELSPETLASYKKKAGQQASELDKAAFSGDSDAKKKIAKANKRFSGIVKATKKEFEQDKKEIDEVQLKTMRKYFAGDKNAQDELKITQMRQYFDELRKKEEQERKRKQELQKVAKMGSGIKQGVTEATEAISEEQLEENLRKWFKEKWVRFGPDGKIRGDCARGDDSEGKPKCLPQSKAHALGKKGRASAAARKRREDPNPERSGKAINVNTKKKSNESLREFAPMGSGDNGDDGFDDNTLKILAAQWWNGDEDPKVEKTLAAAGWEIGQDEGYDNGGVFVVRAGDVNGNSYMSWPVEELTALSEACWKGYHKEGMKTMFGKKYPNCVKNKKTNEELDIEEDRENFNGINLLLQKDDDEVFVKASAGSRELGHVLFVIDGDYLMPQDLEVEERYRGQGIAQTMYDFVKSKGYKIRRSGQQTDAGAGFWAKHRPEQNVWEEQHSESCPHCGGEMVSEELMNEKKDACYYKVKSRYKVWPSAYASGALVKCRKKGAANWGNKSESVAEAIRNTAEFGSRYAEQLAQKVFDQNSNLDTSGRATELLNAGYAIARAELGKIASGIFRDEDFPSDFVSSYNWLKKQGVAETKVSKYKDLGATKSTTHFIKNVTTGKIVSPHRSRQDAEDALVASMRDSNDEFRIVRARKEGVAEEQLDEKWSQKYKDSINCSNPKGFSQKAHCAGKKKNESFVKESAIMKGLK